MTFASAYDSQTAFSVATDALALAISHTKPACEVRGWVHRLPWQYNVSNCPAVLACVVAVPLTSPKILKYFVLCTIFACLRYMECVPQGSPITARGTGGLEIDARNGGLMCNAELCAATGIFAAGDDVSYFDQRIGRLRMRSDDHEVTSGIKAAENMVAYVRPTPKPRSTSNANPNPRPTNHDPASLADLRPRRYATTPVNTHSVGGTTFFSLGRCDASLETQAFWLANSGSGTGSGNVNGNVNGNSASRSLSSIELICKPSRQGVIVYLDGNQVRGDCGTCSVGLFGSPSFVSSLLLWSVAELLVVVVWSQARWQTAELHIVLSHSHLFCVDVLGTDCGDAWLAFDTIA